MGIVYSTKVTVQVPDPIVVRYSLAAKKEERNQIWDFFVKPPIFCTNLHVWYWFWETRLFSGFFDFTRFFNYFRNFSSFSHFFDRY